jgi:transglutaminase-like putative cysteine protease
MRLTRNPEFKDPVSQYFHRQVFATFQDDRAGVLTRELAVDYGLVGPNLRGSGVDWDVRRDVPYGAYRDFKFDSTATDISTPVSHVLAERRGVCQDFAHLGIGCLRSLGLPARYVSGYLHTRATPGVERLVGADASHAWVSVYCGEAGWLGLDPTNDLLVADQHVTLAWGRDYGDVSPIKGVILGGGGHQVEVGVDVEALPG